MYIADLVIVLVLLSAVYIGIARGLWGPLLTEGAFVFSFFLTTRLVAPVAGSFIGSGPWLTTILVLVFFFVAIVVRILARPLYYTLQRLPVTRRIDAPAGGVVHGLAGLVILYLLLGPLLDFDRYVYPLVAGGVATARQIEDYRQALEDRPYLKGVADEEQLKQAEAQAAPVPITSDNLRKVERLLDFYVKNIREPMLESRLAPAVNDIGAQLPVVGRARPYMQGSRYSH
ncbi:MAG: hypothetical protein QOE92_1917 [Chloroflexota bacterium]|nr:hypothetical protein [Chloroflexota bacterium]